jgi:hypothetical protein
MPGPPRTRQELAAVTVAVTPSQQLTTIMLRRLKLKRAVPLSRRPTVARFSSVGLRPFEPRAGLNNHGGETQVRFYAQQPPGGGGFPGFSFQQQHNKGDALKEFVGPPLHS